MDKGVKRLAFYCDESGISGDHPYYGFGALILKYQRRGVFAHDFRELAEGRDWGEVKWTKTTKATLAYYKRLIDYFFKAPHLYFHAIVVRRDWVDVRGLHQGSFDLARRKHFTKFIVNKVAMALKADPRREHEFRVYVDPIASSYDKADEVVCKVGNSMLAQQAKEHPFVDGAHAANIDNVYTIDSKDRPEIQLCDLLLGAIVDAWNQKSSSKHKVDLKDHIASYVGWDNLNRATYAGEKKFNIWYLTDRHRTNQERPVRGAAVKLVHPLPQRRR